MKEDDTNTLKIEPPTLDVKDYQSLIELERIVGKPTLDIDYEYWQGFLENSNQTSDQKRDLITIIWNAMYAFASLGFDRNPIQQVDISPNEQCGQLSNKYNHATSDSQDLVK